MGLPVHILNDGHTDYSRVSRHGWLAWGDRNVVFQNSFDNLGIDDSAREILILSQKVRHDIAVRATFCVVPNDVGRNSATRGGNCPGGYCDVPCGGPGPPPDKIAEPAGACPKGMSRTVGANEKDADWCWGTVCTGGYCPDRIGEPAGA